MQRGIDPYKYNGSGLTKHIVLLTLSIVLLGAVSVLLSSLFLSHVPVFRLAGTTATETTSCVSVGCQTSQRATVIMPNTTYVIIVGLSVFVCRCTSMLCWVTCVMCILHLNQLAVVVVNASLVLVNHDEYLLDNRRRSSQLRWYLAVLGNINYS